MAMTQRSKLIVSERRSESLFKVASSMTGVFILISICVSLTTIIHVSPTEAKSLNLTELETQIKTDSILNNETESLIRKILAKREELKSILVAPSNQEILQASAASALLQQQQQLQQQSASQSQTQQVTSPSQQTRQLTLTKEQTQNFGQMMGSFMNTIGLSMRRMWDFFANALKMMRSMYSKVVG